jgi:hypothetical protein
MRSFLLAIVGVAFVYLAYWFSCEYHGHSTVGNDAHDALIARDAKALLSLVAPEEVKANKLTDDNLQRFIDDYLFRDVGKCVFGEQYNHGPDFPSSTSYLYRDYQVDDGRTMRVTFDATRSGEVVDLVQGLFGARVTLEIETGSLASEWLAMAAMIDRDIDLLDDTGIKGVYLDGELVTWKEYAAYLRGLAKRYPGS